MRFLIKEGNDSLLITLAPDEAELTLEWWQGKILRFKNQSAMATK